MMCLSSVLKNSRNCAYSISSKVFVGNDNGSVKLLTVHIYESSEISLTVHIYESSEESLTVHILYTRMNLQKSLTVHIYSCESSEIINSEQMVRSVPPTEGSWVRMVLV